MTEYIAEYIPLLNSIGHSAVQLVSALALGATLEYAAHLIFPTRSVGESEIDSWSDALLEVLEATAQVVIGGVCVGGLFNWLSRLPSATADPSNGSVFIGVFYSIAQPALVNRLGRVHRFIRDQVLVPEREGVEMLKQALGERKVGQDASSLQTMARVARTTNTLPTTAASPKGRSLALDHTKLQAYM